MRSGSSRRASWGGWLTLPLLVPLLLSVTPTTGAAQESGPKDTPGLREWAGVTGSVRAGYWSSTRDLDAHDHLGGGMVWLKSTRPISERVSFLAEGWAAFRSPPGGGDAAGELREAYVDVRFGRLDLRAGRQIVAWGRADGVNPTDNITGEDLTLLAPDDHERRLGTAAVRASYHVAGVALTGLWLPEFRGHRFPLPPAGPGVVAVRDRERWGADRWAVRVERTGDAIDWSASHLRGVDLTPDLGIGTVEVPGSRPAEAIRLSHGRLRVSGADLAANVGRFALRAEGAYVDTEDAGGRDPFTKNPFIFVVVGGDRTFREHLNVNVQYLYRHVLDYQQTGTGLAAQPAAVAALQAVLNSEARPRQHGASFRVAHRWRRETLEAECAAAAFFGPRGLTLRPKVVYAVSDQWKLLAGAELFRGEATSVFGLLRPNSTGYVEGRWSF
jgi:hypothetical protein